MNLSFNILLSLLFFVLASACSRETLTDPIDDDTPPAIPTGLQVFGARDGEIGIEWNKNAGSNNKYIIYRSVNNQDSYSILDSTFDQYFVDDSLSYDSTYYYKISAKDDLNRESDKTQAVFAQPVNLRPPLVPRSVDISARNWDGSVYIYLNWYSSQSTDVLGYEIYRDTLDNFTPDSTNLIGFTKNLFYVDAKNLELLKDYFYSLKAVDKGGLKSSAAETISDHILNSPELVSPANNSTTNFFSQIQFKTVSKPADYKIVFQTNELFGTVYEIDLYSEDNDKVIPVNVPGSVIFSPYKKYYWRVFTYSVNSNDPNSYSDLYSFTITTQ